MNKKTENRFDKGFEKSIISYVYCDIEELKDEHYEAMTWSKKFIDKHFIEKDSDEFKKLEEDAWKYNDLCK